MKPILNFREVVILCITLLLFIIPIAEAVNDVTVNQSGNWSEYTTTASYTELHNLSLATGNGTTYLSFSWDARVNFTGSYLYGRFLRDGTSLGRFNISSSPFGQAGTYSQGVNETTGTHHYAIEIYSTSGRKGSIYSRNFTAMFLKTGTYGTGAGGGNVSSVTGAPAGVLDCTGTDEITCTISPAGTNFRNDTISTHGTVITALRINDTYFNGSVFPNSKNFRNDTISGKLDISTYGGNFPNSSLINYLPISTYSSNFPNSSLINYLLISTYAGNYPNSSLSNYLLTSLFGSNFNTSFHAEIPVCNATTGKLVSDDGENITCGTDQTGATGGNVSSVTAESPLTFTGTTDVIIKDERTTYPNTSIPGLQNNDSYFNGSVFPNSTQFRNDSISTKEPAISSSTANKFYGWDKTFKDLVASYIIDFGTTVNTTMDKNLSNFTNTPGYITSTYNASYAKGGMSFSIENGTNIIDLTYSNNFTTVYAGTLTKLISHSAQTGSINVSFWNASNSNSYINSVNISSGMDANTTLNYAFADETRIMYNITSVTNVKQVDITLKYTKS